MTKCIDISFSQGEMHKQLSTFFASLLDKDIVDGIMVPTNQPKGGVMQTLITSANKCDQVNPFAPVVPVNSAKLASSLTSRPSGKRLGLVLRSCEERAMIELSKLKQANFHDTLIIGMDCLGRFENSDYKKYSAKGGTTESFIQATASGETSADSVEMATACTICEFPTTETCDIQLGIIGSSPNTITIEAVSEKGEKALTDAGYALQDTPASRAEAVKKLANSRKEKRDILFQEYQQQTNSIDGLEERLNDCINCYNCRVACPVCYCKECVFVTDTFRHKSEQYVNWAQGKGQLKMPTDTTFYHLTRITHISTFCVGCGQCTSACPNDIDLMPIFRTAAEKAQKRFDYLAGRSVHDEQPLAVFDSDELVEVTGQVK